MYFVKKTVFVFMQVLSGITISTAFFITLFIPEVKFSVSLFWQIIIMSIVSSLGNVIFLYRCELSRKQMRVRIIFHYIYVNMVVLCGAFLWDWVEPGSINELVVMLILTAVVYVGVSVISFKKEEKAADVMNEQLRKLNKDEEEKNE